MLAQLFRRTGLAALVLTVLALPAVAAPVPKINPTLSIDKYLLDDTDGVLVIDVKQIMASPAYKKGFQKQVADLVARPEAQTYLKDIGFDPLKDVDRIIICMSKSCRSDNFDAGREDGPFMLFQGKFNSAKLKAKMAALAKDHPTKLASLDAPGGHKIYRIDPRNGPFAALLDANTVVIAGKSAHVREALVKASGKKKTAFVHKEVAGHLKKLKGDVAVQGFALEQMVMNSIYSNVDNGMGKFTLKVRHITLADKGFKEATLSVAIKDDARGSVVWTIKDKAQVKKLTDEFNQGLTEARVQMRRQAEREPKLAPLVRFFEGVSIKSAGQTMTMEGKADVDMVQGLLAAMFSR